MCGGGKLRVADKGREGGKKILTFKNKKRERGRNGESGERGVMENGMAERALN